MHILMVVASKHGSTREIARAIADELRAARCQVHLQDADAVESVTGYDAVIVGRAVYEGTWPPDALLFAAR